MAKLSPSEIIPWQPPPPPRVPAENVAEMDTAQLFKCTARQRDPEEMYTASPAQGLEQQCTVGTRCPVSLAEALGPFVGHHLADGQCRKTGSVLERMK